MSSKHPGVSGADGKFNLLITCLSGVKTYDTMEIYSYIDEFCREQISGAEDHFRLATGRLFHPMPENNFRVIEVRVKQ